MVLASQPSPPSPPGNKVQIDNPTSISAEAQSNTTNRTRNQRRKRKARDDDDKGPPEQTQKLDGSQPSNGFACPFYLNDRHEWHNCLRNYTLNRIVDVRLHLTRAHLLEPQCPICGEVFRESSAESDSAEKRFNTHIQLQNCQPLPSPPPARHGLTSDEFEAVRAVAARRPGRGAADPAAEKWFEIWDIVFPNIPRPASPYISEHPDVQRIRDMNEEILAGEHWRDLTAPASGSSSSLQNVSRDTIVTITERLLGIYRRMYKGSDQKAPEGVSKGVSPTGLHIPDRTSDFPVVDDPLKPPDQAAPEGVSKDASLTGLHIPGSIFDLPVVDDNPEPPARPGSPSQYFRDDYGSNNSGSGLWGHPSGDDADEA